MANALKKRGVFWWFQAVHGQTASVETGIAGEITVTEEGRIQLQLDGPLWFENPSVSFHWDSSRWLPHEARIAGQLGDDERPFVLLLDLVRTDFPFPDDKPVRQSYESTFCFTSDSPLPSDFDPESFCAIRIELTGLEEWLHLDSIQVDAEFRDGDRTEAKISYKNHEFHYSTQSATVIVENLILGMPLFFLSDHAMREVNIRQTNWLVYTPKQENSMSSMVAVFIQIEELIVLLLGRNFRLDWPYFVTRKAEVESWYKLYSLRGPQAEKLPWSLFLWTTFPSLKGTFGNLLTQWQSIAEKYSASCGLYIASMRNPLQQPEHEFVNLVWAIESLHRGWQREAGESPKTVERKEKIQGVLGRFVGPGDKKIREWLEGKLRYSYEPTLEERIVDAFNRLPLRIDRVQLRSFAERCARRRNDISHEGGAKPGEDVNAFQAEIRDLAEALRYLFHALLLHQIGVQEEILLKAMTHGSLAERDILPALRSVEIDLLARD